MPSGETTIPSPSLPPIRQAMILCAGEGSRLRPLTESVPKPLVPLVARAPDRPGAPAPTPLGWLVDALVSFGIEKIVINTHYLADKISAFVAELRQCMKNPPTFILSHETKLLDSGGGIYNALNHFEGKPFYVLNGDTLWATPRHSGPTTAIPSPHDYTACPHLCPLTLMAEGHKAHPQALALLGLATLDTVKGYDQAGDYKLDAQGWPHRIGRGAPEVPHHLPFVFTGLRVVHPRLFHGVPYAKGDAFSLLPLLDKAEHPLGEPLGHSHGTLMDNDPATSSASPNLRAVIMPSTLTWWTINDPGTLDLLRQEMAAGYLSKKKRKNHYAHG